ncbi:MAG: inorganic phosphate transporter [Armatimonadota bacterium]
MVTMTEEAEICACCGEPLQVAGVTVSCKGCGNTYHRTCWEQQGGCTTDKCTGGQIDSEQSAAELVKRTETNEALPWIIAGSVTAFLILIGFIAVQIGIPVNSVLVIAVVIAALTFDYVNGMHDAGNAIATVISTRVLTPAAALAMAAVLNLAGAMFFTGVAKSIVTKFAAADSIGSVTPVMILCGLVGASVWSFWTARLGVPVSTSHSLFGGLIGVFLLGGIKLNMAYLTLFGTWMVFAPLLAFSTGWLLMVVIMWIFRHVPRFKINQHFRVWQIVSSASVAFMHGSNDAQKAMGIITLALVAGKFLIIPAGQEASIPFWVKFSCAAVIALGTGIGGMRVIKTLGHKIIKLDPVHGFTAETVAAATIFLVTKMHIPVSTTHIISSSILGIGASKRLSAVRWGIAINIVAAWIFTIPTCAVAGALLYMLVSHLGLK